jgi:hypothetical protein
MRTLAIAISATVALFAVSISSAWAVPYASAARNTSGSTWEFVLNEAADNVTVQRNTGGALNLGARPAGRHTFDLGAATTFEIDVSKSAPEAWSLINGPGNAFANFTLPTGVAINTNPSSQFFGTVYVANGNPVATLAGRSMGDGVYALTADMKGVDLTTFAAVADPNDTTQAKAPGWTVAGETVSPWRLALDGAGNVLASDWSDGNGGIKYASPNLTTGGLVLAGEEGLPETAVVHGSIAGKPVIVSGSVGNDLVLAAMDEDLSPFNSIWRWDVGDVTAYDQPPTSVIDAASLNAQSFFGGWIQTVNGVRAGNHYSPQHDKWYLVQNRNVGSEAGIFVVEAGVDGFSPTLLWDSLSFSNDPNGDQDPSDALDGNNAADDIQDVFRNIGDVTLSPDGTKLLVHRIVSSADNPFQSGAVTIIPLDEDGVPDIQVSGGQMTNVTFISTPGDALGHSSGAQLEFDAAGNLYVANSGAAIEGQMVYAYSPGGNTKATTRSNGTFSLVELAPSDANFDDDGDVDGADFLAWQRTFGGPGGAGTGDANGDNVVNSVDFDIWKQQFGTTGLASAAGTAAPEPGSLALVLAGLTAAAALRRRAA